MLHGVKGEKRILSGRSGVSRKLAGVATLAWFEAVFYPQGWFRGDFGFYERVTHGISAYIHERTERNKSSAVLGERIDCGRVSGAVLFL
jgi:hypothetical protein